MNSQYRLPPRALKLAVGFKLLDLASRKGCISPLDALLAALPREDPEDVTQAYNAITTGGWLDRGPDDGRHGLRAERLRELRQPLSRSNRHGLTVRDLAHRAGVDRHTMACALEHHGYLELVPYGGTQRRRLVSPTAEDAGYGHNVDAERKRIGCLEGYNRACPFPVFYEDRVDDILWSLDLEGIRETAAEMTSKRRRLAWLLEAHGYLPDAYIAVLAGCSLRGVKAARSRQREKVHSQVRGRTDQMTASESRL